MDETSPEFQEVQQKINNRVKELWEAFRNESIRVMFIILAAEVDRLLVELIKRFIKEERKKDGDERLFGGFGPLQSFGVRTEIAYRLGLISKEDADGMDMLRKLRNHCAHTIKEFSLEAEPFKSQFLDFVKLTSKRDNLGLCLFGVICPKTDEELTYFACVSYIIKQELTLRAIEQTQNRFFDR